MLIAILGTYIVLSIFATVFLMCAFSLSGRLSKLERESERHDFNTKMLNDRTSSMTDRSKAPYWPKPNVY